MARTRKTKAKPPEPARKVEPPKEQPEEEMLLERAHKWAQLHGNPKTRVKMDAVMEGLSARQQRLVYLCGGRISSGLEPRLART